jgi:NAD(P)-dependent dehydrogenase (short-subunit alcohol dehydrogenase family)
VNNAGIGTQVGIEDESLELFRRTLEVNTTAVWHLSKLAGTHMVAQGGGSVINIASILGHVASAPMKQANYTASKGAVVNLTRELAVQWGRKGVRVNAICPGFFPSEMTSTMEGDDRTMEYLRSNSPIPRLGLERELDGALLLLASDAGTFITGQSIVVDGGWTAR